MPKWWCVGDVIAASAIASPDVPTRHAQNPCVVPGTVIAKRAVPGTPQPSANVVSEPVRKKK
jgi:hypothetical protein